jgi:hypothetical protein
MAYPAHKSDGQISRIHSMAVCNEIGERLGASLRQDSLPIPSHLMALVRRLRDEPAALQPGLNSD